MADAPADRVLHCVVVTPEKALLDAPADFVVLPMYDGELGVLPGRAPLIGRLGYGELRIRRGRDTQRFFVDGGFAQVRANTVTVLTPRALEAEKINVEAVKESLKSAREALARANTPEAQDASLKAQQRARVQLRMALVRGEETAAGHG
jgi:F-type H+-transporting ATPase subunit epsilon